MTSGSFTYGTYPRHDPYSSGFPSRSDTFASRLPQATRLSLTPRATDHVAFTTLEVLFGCPTTRGASLLISQNAYRVTYPTPLGTTASPPGVTHESSTPCHPQTPWYERWMRTPSPPYCWLDLALSLADRFVIGVAPIDYGPVLLRKPTGFGLTTDPLSSGCRCSRQSANVGPSPWLFPPFPTSCPFRVHLIRAPRPARHYPRFWIWRSLPERQRDLNPPDSCAAQRTLWACPTSHGRACQACGL